MATKHKDLEFQLEDAGGSTRTFKTFDEAAALAIAVAASTGREVNLDVLCWVLDDIAEVYGHKSIARLYEGTADDRFEPETGRYHELSRIADKAYEKAVVEAAKAEKIMRS